MQDLPIEFYKKNNQIMSETYSHMARKLGIVWDNYFDKVSSFLQYDDYKIWVFLCGVEETFKDALSIRLMSKKGAKKYVKEQTTKRLLSIRGKNDLELYLKNM